MESSSTFPTGARRSSRIAKEIPIVLSGSDTEGKQFSETTKTIMLSQHGASILSKHKLIPEQEIFVLAVAANQEIEARVCGQIGERQDGHIYGLAFLDPSSDFWGVEFPPSEKLENELTSVILECCGCRQRAVADFDATEMDVCHANRGVRRFCKRCLTTMAWKLVDKSYDPPPGTQEGDIDLQQRLETEQIASKPSSPNRRKERRAKVTLNACIPSSDVIDEIVACEDMSRSGFCFRSTRKYPKEAFIDVAIPYATDSMSIFVPAQIANVRKLQQENLYRYGASYITSLKKQHRK